MKRIYDFSTLEIGSTYFVRCGVWSGRLIYCGHVHAENKYTFTYGNNVDDWKTSINIVSCKSNIKVYREEEKADDLPAANIRTPEAPEQEREEEKADDLNEANISSPEIPEQEREEENADDLSKYYDLHISTRHIRVNDYCLFKLSSVIYDLIDDVNINLSNLLMYDDCEIRDYKTLRFVCNSLLFAFQDVKKCPWNSDDIEISLPFNVIKTLLRAISYYRSEVNRELRNSILLNESEEEEKHELEALTIAESRFGRALHPAIYIDIDESSDIELPF